MYHITKLIIVGLLWFAWNSVFAEDFQLTVARKYRDAKCTMGYLEVNSKTTCYTLEPPWKDNKTDVSSIPVGKYPATLRYDHTDRWRIELQRVPNRTNVQIHIGNYPSNTLGCILVGKNADVDKCAVLDSTAAYRELKRAFYGSDNPVSSPNKSISVVIKDDGPK